MSSGSSPNVLFVVMDTVRKDHLGPYGYHRDTTPGLDAFAEEAAVFENAVAPAPWTLPVHASMFTGMYPSQHGADQENPYLEGATTLAQSLSAADYDTACYSSNAWITPYTHLTDGFDDQDNFFEVMPGDFLSGPLAKAWQTLNDNPRLRSVADKLVSLGNTAHEYFSSAEGADSKTPRVIDRTKAFIDGADDDWFTFINLMDAHLPYHPPEEFKEEFAPGVDATAVCQNSKEYNSGARAIDDAEWSDIRGLYDAEIAHIDSQLTRLFDWLKRTDRWDDTAVVVCADHGELHGEHDLYGHEFGLYDPIINVPLLVKHPDLGTERREDTVELVDLYHTVLDTLDADATATSSEAETVSFDPTRSLLSSEYREFDAVADPDPAQAAAPDGDIGFVEYSRPVVELKQLEEKAAAAGITLDEDSRFYARMRAARRPDAKYVRIDRIEDEAFRLDSDPGEEENLIDSGDGGSAAQAGVEDKGSAARGGVEDKGSAARAAVEDEAIDEVEAALASFESDIGGAWTGAAEGEVTDEALEDMDEETQERLRDLGYME